MPKPINENIRSVYAERDDGTHDKLLDVAADKLAQVVNAVSSSGKTGKLTITIDVRKGPAGTLALRGGCVAKIPKEPSPEALLWPTPEGNLLSEDPAQEKLDLKPVRVDPPVALRNATATA